MSIEKDIQEIQKLMEETLFKPAKSSEVKVRHDTLYDIVPKLKVIKAGFKSGNSYDMTSDLKRIKKIITTDKDAMIEYIDENGDKKSNLKSKLYSVGFLVGDTWFYLSESVEYDILQEETLFKPTKPREVEARKEEYDRIKTEKLYADANKAIPGIVDKLKAEYPEAVVQTIIAYADTRAGRDALGIVRKKGEYSDLGYLIRELDWDGVWTDAETFLDQCRIVHQYNEFNIEVANQLVDFFKDKQFRLARESSVAVYIKPVDNEAMNATNRFRQDETRREGNELRLWWD